MDTLLRDVRLTLRNLRKSPGFTTMAVLTLAIGIGASTAIFSVVDALLLRPLRFVEPERLVVVRNLTPEGDRVAASYGDYKDWRRETDVFASVALFQPGNVNLADGGEAERVPSVSVSEDFFATLGLHPALGRTFLLEEHTVERPTAVVLSDGLWRRRFGGDPAVIGRTIRLNGVSSTVVGVMPPAATWPEETALWRPIPVAGLAPADLQRRDNFIWQSVARLVEGASLEQARARVAALAALVAAEHPEFPSGWSATVIPLDEWITGPEIRTTLYVLLGAVALVLLIACVNVANLLLARSAGRVREIAVRRALGASRPRLFRQLLTESCVLAALGGAGGALLGAWGVETLAALAPDGTPRIDEVRLDGNLLLFALGLTLLTGLLFGFAPALHAAAARLASSLRERSGRTSESSARARARGTLVVVEVALSLMLVVGAGLMIKSLVRLQSVDPGVRVEGLLTAMITVPRATYESERERAAFYEELLERVRGLPGVESAGATSALPVGGGGMYLGRAFLREGQPEPPAASETEALWNLASPGYFRTVGLPLLRGRDFTARDDSASTPVMILSETMAQRLFPEGDALGKRVRSWRDENVLREVVGVVADVRFTSLTEESEPLVYVPHAQDPYPSMAVAVRAEGDPASLAGALRRVVASLDKDLALADMRTMPEVVRTSLADKRFSTLLLSLFAGIALLLAVVGLYGVISYSVAQRTREIGIRVALGAAAPDVRRLVLKRGGSLTAAGLLLGIAGAVLVSRVLSSLLYEVSSTDPLTFAAVAALLGAVALLASWIPARAATRVDPLVALRTE